MSGIYIHIPYCKQACHYCDFHFSTSLKSKDKLILALIKEIELRKNEFPTDINSLYIGGGTPSLLNEDEIGSMFTVLKKIIKLHFLYKAVSDLLYPKACELCNKVISHHKKSICYSCIANTSV